MTQASVSLDDLTATPNKSTTTVAMDFGRVSLDRELILYLFGTPGQHRFWFMWDELVHGAIGAVVLVDTRRLADCFPAVDFFENRELPYILALNCFDGVQRHQTNDVRDAMSVSESIPIVTCDARKRESTKQTLISLVEYVVQLRTRRAGISAKLIQSRSCTGTTVYDNIREVHRVKRKSVVLASSDTLFARVEPPMQL